MKSQSGVFGMEVALVCLGDCMPRRAVARLVRKGVSLTGTRSLIQHELEFPSQSHDSNRIVQSHSTLEQLIKML